MADEPIVHSTTTMVTVTGVFDINEHTGFMASVPPPDRLPPPWEAWEVLLDAAVESNLQLGDKLDLTEQERITSKRWRDRVRMVRYNAP